MKKLARPLAAILVSSLIFVGYAPPALTAEEGETGLTSGLKTLQGAGNAASQFMGSVGMNNMQMQQMGNLYSALLTQGQLGQAGLGELNQMKMNMAMAMEEVKNCAKKAEKPISKFKKAKLPMPEEEPTCNNYGRIIDSVKATLVKIGEANTRLTCVLSFQNKMKQIADTAKGPLSKLTTAAQDSWNTYDQIINMHKNISEKLDGELNSENGFKAQLAKLEELSQELLAALDVRGEENKSGGLARRLDDLKGFRNSAANDWHFSIMQDTESCFFNDNTQQCGTRTASPMECILQTTYGYSKDKPGVQPQNKMNMEEIETAIRKNAGLTRSIDMPAKLDIKNPLQFEVFSKRRFGEILQAKLANLNQANLVGKANKAEIMSFFKSKYQECYDQATKRFRAGLATENNPYKDKLKLLEENEKNIAAEAKLLLKRAQTQMNSFRTAFTKVYQSDLPQFSANCTSQTDPYQVVDCIKKISATLDAGLAGTQQSIQLSDGSTFTSKEGITQLRVQALGTDATGKPTTTTSSVQCVGFKECLNFLERSKEHHDGEIQAQTSKQTQFVQEHNKTVDAVMKGVSDQYSMISQLTNESVAQLNQNLTELGVKGSIKTEPIVGEPLVKNEKTGIYDMPTDMQKALAGSGSVIEIKEPEETQQAMTRRGRELGEKAKAAYDKKALCEVSKKMYGSIAAQLGDCNAKSLCSPSRMNRLIPSMEDLFRRSGNNPSKDAKNDISRRLRECMSDAKSDAREYEDDSQEEIDNLSEDVATLTGRIDEIGDEISELSLQKNSNPNSAELQQKIDTLTSERAQERSRRTKLEIELRKAKSEAAKAKKSGKENALVEGKSGCSGQAFADLHVLASSSRDTLGSTNAELSANLQSLTDKCSAYNAGDKDDEGIEASCRNLKENAESVSIPEEGESPESEKSKIGSSSSNEPVSEAD